MHLGRDSLTRPQASARTGLVRTTVHGDRVHLTGHAITVLEGTLDHTAGEERPPADRQCSGPSRSNGIKSLNPLLGNGFPRAEV